MTEKEKNGRPTIQAVARRAGVSRATVSLILANRPDVVSRFRPETVLRVRSAAAEMGYQANLTALSLRGRHPSFFGLVLRGADGEEAMAWHHQAFEGQFLAGALEASCRLGLYPVLATQNSPEPDGAMQRVLGVLDGGVFGAVFRTPLPVLDAPIRRQIERGLPVVIVFPESLSACASNAIDVDNVEAGRQAALLLHRARRRHWVIVRDTLNHEAVGRREQGVRQIAAEVGARVELLEIPPGLSEEGVVQALAPRIRQFRADGLYATASFASVAAMQSCRQVGIAVPDQLSLVGCDASLWRAPGTPGITSVDVSWRAVGELAVQKMADLRTHDESVFANIQLPPSVAPGGTCLPRHACTAGR